MHFRRERRNGVVVSLQETLEAGKEDSALTLSDVLQDGFCMEDACERQDEARRLRRLIEGLPARERKKSGNISFLCLTDLHFILLLPCFQFYEFSIPHPIPL